MNTADIAPEPPDFEANAKPSGALATEFLKYRDLFLEYCLLALRPTLSQAEQERTSEIFEMAEKDPVLNFWIEEADYLVADHWGLVNEAFIKRQQDQFRREIRQSWIDSFWRELQHSTKALQVYLQRRGCYAGSIDGVFGPYTQEAIRQFEIRYPERLPKSGCI